MVDGKARSGILARMVLPLLGLLSALAIPRLACASDADPCALVPQAIEVASQLRELEVLQPVPCQALSQAEFQALVDEELAKDNPPERVRYEGIASKMLGTIPEPYDYERCIATDYGVDVLAFYHPEKQSIVLPAWEETPFDVLVHEGVHALQDQHFNLRKLRDAANASSDSALALSALAEGDAAIIQALHNHKINTHGPDTPSEPVAPPVLPGCGLPTLLRKQFEFPYDYGEFFVAALRKRGEVAELNRAFHNPPRSTREVLYPREYSPALPRSNRPLPAALPRGFAREKFRRVYQEILGEYFIRAYLREHVSREDGVRSGKGWRAGGLALYIGNNVPCLSAQPISAGASCRVLVWETLWENEKEAAQFRTAQLRALSRRFNQTLQLQSSRVRIQPSADREFRLEQQGATVLHVIVEEVEGQATAAFARP